MSTSDQGTTPLAILWTLTAITLVFLALRLVSRWHIVEEFGADDYVYSISAVRTPFRPSHPSVCLFFRADELFV